MKYVKPEPLIVVIRPEALNELQPIRPTVESQAIPQKEIVTPSPILLAPNYATVELPPTPLPSTPIPTSPILARYYNGHSNANSNQKTQQEASKGKGTPQEEKGKTYPPRWSRLYLPAQAFYINKLTPASLLPPSTVRWIRNASDERAAQEGYRYHEKSGQRVVDWVQEHCILYEGDKANTPLVCEDWQYEYFMQLFGWQFKSPELGRWIRRFTQCGVWIAKKNAKSPTLAATGLYMFIGDNEQGQHCYSVARDGKQAKIAHTHVMEMVWNSPILNRECKVKLTDYTVQHRKSKSSYTIVCADNARSTEGYNGSIFVDETHVVDQVNMDRLKRAGISRTQPVHVEMSTAGNNADGYGYNRYQYGQRICKMERDTDYNPRFLFMDFSIDQKLSVERMRDRDYIESVAAPCNPSLGRIIRREEFMSDWLDSTQSDTELRKFGMYRLNLWLRDSAVWLELADWLRCAESPLSRELTEYEGKPTQYTLEDLKPYPCVAGLDLSQTKDLSALSLIFAVPDDELNVRPYTWTWHWLPEPTAVAYQRYIDFKSNEFGPIGGQHQIHLMKQATIDHETIATKLEWIRANFDLRGLGYDMYNAVPLVRCLLNDYGWDENAIIKVPQQMRIMGPITKEFERWVIRNEVHHPNNAVLSWQFQHAALYEDKQGNYKVIKPHKDDYRKVDGIVSLLIAGVVFTLPEFGLWSRDSGSILLYERSAPIREGQSSMIYLSGDKVNGQLNSSFGRE